MSTALIREASDGKYYATVASDIACYAVSQTIGNNRWRIPWFLRYGNHDGCTSTGDG